MKVICLLMKGYITTYEVFKKKKNLEPESEQAFISNYVCVLNRLVMSNSLQPHGLYPTRLLCPGACDSAGKNTGLYLTTVYSSVKGDKRTCQMASWDC